MPLFLIAAGGVSLAMADIGYDRIFNPWPTLAMLAIGFALIISGLASFAACSCKTL